MQILVRDAKSRYYLAAFQASTETNSLWKKLNHLDLIKSKVAFLGRKKRATVLPCVIRGEVDSRNLATGRESLSPFAYTYVCTLRRLFIHTCVSLAERRR